MRAKSREVMELDGRDVERVGVKSVFGVKDSRILSSMQDTWIASCATVRSGFLGCVKARRWEEETNINRHVLRFPD